MGSKLSAPGSGRRLPFGAACAHPEIGWNAEVCSFPAVGVLGSGYKKTAPPKGSRLPVTRAARKVRVSRSCLSETGNPGSRMRRLLSVTLRKGPDPELVGRNPDDGAAAARDVCTGREASLPRESAASGRAGLWLRAQERPFPAFLAGCRNPCVNPCRGRGAGTVTCGASALHRANGRKWVFPCPAGSGAAGRAAPAVPVERTAGAL